MSKEPGKAGGASEQGPCPRCLVLEAELASLREQLRQALKRIEQLEAQVRRNSSNSHQPPSSDPPSAPPRPGKEPTGRRPGGQPGHPFHQRQLLPPERVDQYRHYYPEQCEHCQRPLPPDQRVEHGPPLAEQVFELPELAGTVEEHQAHAIDCPYCGHVNRAKLPEEVLKHPFGPRLCALASYLAGRCHDGRRTVQEILADVFALPISLGALSNREAEMSRALKPAWEQAQKAVRRCSVKHADETGWVLGGENCWLWLAAGKKVACFLVHPNRNDQAFEQLLGQEPGGMLVSDRLSTYNRMATERRGICWAHLKRDFVKWQEMGKATRLLGSDGLGITQKVFGVWRDFTQGRIGRMTLRRRIKPLRRRMKQVLRWGLRCGQKAAVGFCRSLLKLEPALWLFAQAEGVEPTNNHAERLLRQAVLWRKNSFGSHSQRGCRFVERMLTVVQTLRLRGRSVLQYLQQAITRYRSGMPCPSLLATR